MTTLDLNAYGVTEMSHAEKVAENGGGIGKWILRGIKAIKAAWDNREELLAGAEEGYAAADKLYNP